MRIALLTDGIFPFVMGGMQRHSHNLAKYLAKAGVQVDLYHTATKITPEMERLEALGAGPELKSFVIPPPKLGIMPGHYLRESKQYATSVFNAFEAQQVKTPVDFVYVKGFSGWKLLDNKAKGLNLPPVGLNFHGLEMFQQAASLKAKLEHLMLRGAVGHNLQRADYHFSYGGKITDILKARGIKDERILEIPGGIERSWVSEAPAPVGERLRFLFVGRNERRKGLIELNAVLRKLIHKRDFRFRFIGPIPADMQVDSDKCDYQGAVQDTHKLHQLADECQVLVCPSYSEGMPNVILEAMARGLVIIATDVGAVAKMVDHKNGWLIDPGNTSQLMEAMEKALELPATKMEQLGKASIERVRSGFLWQDIIKLTIQKISQTNQT